MAGLSTFPFTSFLTSEYGVKIAFQDPVKLPVPVIRLSRVTILQVIMSKPQNITVLISGNGSNLQAIIDATNPEDSSRKLQNACVTHVISNRKGAFGLERAKKADISTTYHNLVAYKKKQESNETGYQKAREEFDADLAKIIVSHDPKPDLVVCAGWMHILSAGFIDALKEANVPIINLHPALPGQFNGAEAIHRAYAAFQRGEIANTGVMVHHVISEVDMGEPVIVREIEMQVGEAEYDLETRIHAVEWEIIVEATAKVLKEIKQSQTKN